MGLTFLLLVVTIATAVALPTNIHDYLVMPQSDDDPGSCLSWRLAAETNNIRGWTEVPEACRGYFSQYMLERNSRQYRRDCELVSYEALKFARSNPLPRDGRSVWVFDVEDTTLASIGYLVSQGSWVINETSLIDWSTVGEAPAIPGTLELYKELISLGYKIVFISGLPESQVRIVARKLKAAGFGLWEKLILKGENDNDSAVVYKSSKRSLLLEYGYRIEGNMGDQWSDITGANTGKRTFKLPNPIYYIP